jgi:hypothetical protein
MPRNPEEQETVERWARHVMDDMVPKVDSSTVCISLVPTTGETPGDVKYWVELGYMICADKPIMIVVMGDRPVPDHIQRVADEIVRLPEGVSPESSQQLADAIKAFAEKYPDMEG